jgi:hypothetical protein
MDDQWKEKLRCPRCNNTGVVDLSQPKGTHVPVVDVISDGFRGVETEYGINFECEACEVEVAA